MEVVLGSPIDGLPDECKLICGLLRGSSVHEDTITEFDQLIFAYLDAVYEFSDDLLMENPLSLSPYQIFWHITLFTILNSSESQERQ